MKKLKQLIISAAFVCGFGLVLAPASVGANVIEDNGASAIEDTCADPLNADSIICKNKDDDIKGVIGAVVNALLFLLGIAAVIVIILGGITYTVSAGNEASIKRAKDMILYAVIGLVIAFSAYAIVNWVLNAFG